LPISLPEKTSPAAVVKCPLCAAEYLLQEALDQIPPCLLVLDPGPAPESVLGTEPGSMDSCPTGMLPQLEFPDQDPAAVEGGPKEGRAANPDEAALAHFADDSDIESRVALGDEAPAEGAAIIGGELQHGSDLSQTMPDAEGPGADSFALSHGAGTSMSSQAAQRKHASGGGVGEAVKAIVGGAVGLAIGYYILLWIGNDFLDLGKYLPTWLKPS